MLWRLWSQASALIVAAFVVGTSSTYAAQYEAKWDSLSDGLHFGRLTVNLEDGSVIRLITVKASLLKFTIKIIDPINLVFSLRKSVFSIPILDPSVDPIYSAVPTYSINQISRILAPTALINGGFREPSPDIVPTGLVKIDGKLIAPLSKKSRLLTGVLCVGRDTVSVVKRRGFDLDVCQSALQAGPLVIDPGGKNGISQREMTRPKANRSVLCITENSEIVLIHTTEAHLYEIGKALQEASGPFGFRCKVALNLSGASDSGLFIGAAVGAQEPMVPEGGLVFGTTDGALATAIALVPREDVEEKVDTDFKDAKDFILELADFLIWFLSDDERRENIVTEKSREDFKEIIPESFDIEFIVSFVLGRFARTAKPDEVDAFTDQYTTFFVNHFSQQLSRYAGEYLVVTGARRQRDESEVIVKSRIQQPRGAYIEVDWKVRDYTNRNDDSVEGEKTYRIVDIVLEGVSMLITQRAELASFRASRNAQTVTDLVNILEERNAQF